MSRISVLVPVYNVEGYLDACLGSLEDQSLTDIDIICVNDGSTDGSRAVLSQWEQRDPRVRVIDKPNGGLSSARNAGIDAATTEYVCFLDSDDRFHPNACAEMVRLLDKTGADVLTFGATLYPLETQDNWLEHVLSPRDVVFDGYDTRLMFREPSRPFSWRTACRREFLLEKGIRFDEGVRFGEDQLFDFAIYPRASRTALSSEKLYEYRVAREGSLMARMNADVTAKMLEHVNIVDHILKDWQRGGFLGMDDENLVEFIMEFVMREAIRQDDDGYRRVTAALRPVLLSFWDEETLAAMDVLSTTHALLMQATLSPNGMPFAARRTLALAYYLEHRHPGFMLRLERRFRS
ncbi:MAG: glycosyltransferase [Olsenella sp.]|nr:glycosyltransferase [Olsenella sp.]MCI1810711.1 glycosyltransferase [Olsenella sp.]MCI1879451.1 glycosyltransferase [Olsenella sp.]